MQTQTTPPLFFQPATLSPGSMLQLDEAAARHIVQVLRMREGSAIALTDGRGTEAGAVIENTGKKSCTVRILQTVAHEPRQPALHMGISFTRNPGRNEWLLEKIAELGVRSIWPLVSRRSGKERIRPDRWQNILVSAIMQSRQFHIPELHAPASLEEILQAHGDAPRKLIAHCIGHIPREPLHRMLLPDTDTLILIGPEGDFTEEEVTSALGQGAVSISMGQTRLRTETAAMAACTCFNLLNP